MNQQFPKRIQFLGGMLAICGLLFGIRLFYLQIVQHEYYQAEATAEHQKKFSLPAKRGLIYSFDRNELTPLVMNEPVYLLYGDPRHVVDVSKAAQDIARIAGGSIPDYEELLSKKDSSYVVLAKKLNKTQADAIKSAEIPGIGLKEDQQRFYPEDKLAAQVLGFVNGEGEGQYGIESFLNDKLRGRDGQLKAITDVHGIPLTISQDTVLTPAVDGKNIALTIDRNIQSAAEDILKSGLEHAKATKGSVLVMDPSDNSIVAMANSPTFSPAEYNQVEDYQVFQNNIISYPYEIGSVSKVLTMAAGINEGVVNNDTTFMNNGFVQVDDAKINNALDDVNGVRTMQEVLDYSLNTGVVFVLSQMGNGDITYEARQKLYDYLTNRFKFGKALGVELAGEQSGLIYSPDDVQGNRVRYANMSFGQGMTITMLQMASAYSSVINGGTYYMPHVVAGEVSEDGILNEKKPKILNENIVSENTASQIRDMSVSALESASSLEVAKRAGYRIGGKTGTSQIIDPETGKYIDENAIGTYIGFGGNETPKYVIMVRVDDAKIGGYTGSTAAAPIFADMSNWLIDYYRIPPIK